MVNSALFQYWNLDFRNNDMRMFPRENWLVSIIRYMIDSRERISVNLQVWLNEQLQKAQSMDDLVRLAHSLRGQSDDATMLNVLIWTKQNKVWKSDSELHNRLEKWEDVDKAFYSRYMDCETGSLLMYCLARIAGVPEYAIYLMCGDVQDNKGELFGHCWIAYIPQHYPLNFAFMDWCEWYSAQRVSVRDKFAVIVNTIFQGEHQSTGKYATINSVYPHMWFAFNEKKSYRYFRRA